MYDRLSIALLSSNGLSLMLDMKLDLASMFCFIWDEHFSHRKPYAFTLFSVYTSIFSLYFSIFILYSILLDSFLPFAFNMSIASPVSATNTNGSGCSLVESNSSPFSNAVSMYIPCLYFTLNVLMQYFLILMNSLACLAVPTMNFCWLTSLIVVSLLPLPWPCLPLPGDFPNLPLPLVNLPACLPIVFLLFLHFLSFTTLTICCCCCFIAFLQWSHFSLFWL